MGLKDNFNRAKKSKDAKVLVENFAYLSLLQVAGYIFPLLTLPYLARVIGVDSFGKIAFAAAVIGYFNTVADWGFNYTATRDVAKSRDNKENISEIFSNVFWSRCLLALLSLMILITLVLLVPKFREISSLLLITFLIIPGRIMFPDWFFQALEKMKYITILNFISKLLFTAAVFIFIKEKSDFILQPLFISLGFVVSGTIAMYVIVVRWDIKLHKPNLYSIIKTIKDSTDVFINNLMPNLYNSFSVLLLGFWGGPISNGILDAGRKFVNVTEIFLSIIYRTFFPYLSRKPNKHKSFSIFGLTISIIISIILFLLAPLLIELFYSREFFDSILVLKIYSVSIVFTAMYYIYGFNYLVIIGKEKIMRNITAFTSIFGFIIAFPLIYYFDYIGAALVYLITTCILGSSLMAISIRFKIRQ